MGMFDPQQRATTASTRKKQANRSGVVTTSETRDARTALTDPTGWMTKGHMKGISNIRGGERGGFNPGKGMFGMDWNFETIKGGPKNRERNLEANTDWDILLKQAPKRKKSRSSKDSSQEVYSTSETRFGKANYVNPNSGYATIGPETSRIKGDISQMFRSNSAPKGAVRRTVRGIV